MTVLVTVIPGIATSTQDKPSSHHNTSSGGAKDVDWEIADEPCEKCAEKGRTCVTKAGVGGRCSECATKHDRCSFISKGNGATSGSKTDKPDKSTKKKAKYKCVPKPDDTCHNCGEKGHWKRRKDLIFSSYLASTCTAESKKYFQKLLRDLISGVHDWRKSKQEHTLKEKKI